MLAICVKKNYTSVSITTLGNKINLVKQGCGHLCVDCHFYQTPQARFMAIGSGITCFSAY